MSDLIIEADNEQKGYKVTLPCNPEDFTDFVSSLLGKGLTIEKNYSDLFKLDILSIQQLCHLITQRAAQNAGKLVTYSAKLYFSDRSSISFNSPDDFLNHNEIKKIQTTALSIELTYLIHFPKKHAPEKQTVSVYFRTGEFFESRHDSQYIFTGASEVTLQIHHSEKTWANDIVNLFNNFLANHVNTPNRSTLLWNKLNGHIAGISGFLCFGIGLLGIAFSYQLISEDIAAKAELALNNQNEALKFLVTQTFDPTIINFSIASVFYIGILMFISIFAAEKITNSYAIPVTSHLIFTDEDKKICASNEKRSNSKSLSFFAELLKGVIIGIVANVLFTLFWR